MKLNKFFVSFEDEDINFVKKYGLIKAGNIVRKHYKKYDVAFINDTYQLAGLFNILRKDLFKITREINAHYKKIILKKKNGSNRIIYAPDGVLKRCQRKILEKILYKIPVSEYATAYLKGKNLNDNASPHTNHKYLLKMDITDFFGSITYLQVISSAFNSKMYPPQIGAMLTTLCCKDDALPQGAPTSPMLSNIVMKNFDDIIGDWCKNRNISYTRYCDDLTFSSDFPLYNVYHKVCEMLEWRGFEVNESKTKFITNASSQRVTGLTVNEKVSIPSEYKRQLRQELYYVLKFGFGSGIRTGKKEYINKYGALDVQRYYNHLNGKLNYILQIEPENKWFLEAREKLKQKYIRCT